MQQLAPEAEEEVGGGGADRHESENAATQLFCPEHVADCARIT